MAISFCYVYDSDNFKGFVRWYYEKIIKKYNASAISIDDLRALGPSSVKKYNFLLTRKYYHELSLLKFPPIFVQNENPLWYVGKLSPRVHYLVDQSFISFYENASVLPIWCEVKTGVSVTRDIDVLFIGTSRGAKFEGVSGVDSYAEKLVNHFGSIFLSSEIEERAIRGVLGGEQGDSKYVMGLNMAYQLVRFKRRNLILEQLVQLACEGRRVVCIGDMKPTNSTIQVVTNIDSPDIETYFSRSKIVVCTTPNHTSMLNERFVASLAYGSIPVFEPFPQYCIFGSWDSFAFNYSGSVFAEKVRTILDDYPSYLDIFYKQALVFSRLHSSHSFIDGLTKVLDGRD